MNDTQEPVQRLRPSSWIRDRQDGYFIDAPKELDGDLILEAQAKEVGAVVTTENVGYLSLFVDARHWQ